MSLPPVGQTPRGGSGPVPHPPPPKDTSRSVSPSRVRTTTFQEDTASTPAAGDTPPGDQSGTRARHRSETSAASDSPPTSAAVPQGTRMFGSAVKQRSGDELSSSGRGAGGRGKSATDASLMAQTASSRRKMSRTRNESPTRKSLVSMSASTIGRHNTSPGPSSCEHSHDGRKKRHSGNDGDTFGNVDTFTPTASPYAPAPVAPPKQETEEELNRKVAIGVLSTKLGDLEELANDVGSASVYAIRTDQLNGWAQKMRSCLTGIKNGVIAKEQAAAQQAVMLAAASAPSRRRSSVSSGLLSLGAGQQGAGGGDIQFLMKQGAGAGLVGPPQKTNRKMTTTGAAGIGASAGMGGMSINPGSGAFSLGGSGTVTAGSGVMSGAGATPGLQVHTVSSLVSGALFLALDACVAAVDSEWGRVFVFQQKTDELVLAASVVAKNGKKSRIERPGSLRLATNSGIHGHVLATGIGVNVAHAYAEEEFDSKLDTKSQLRTHSTLVFPLMRPGCTSQLFGVIEVSNKISGQPFTCDDEARVSESAHIVSLIITRFPNDVTNPGTLDHTCLQQAAPSRDVAESFGRTPSVKLPGDKNGPRHVQLVFRTTRAGHVKRSEVMSEASKLSAAPSITEATQHITKVNDAWRDAVLLNIELERQISKLHDSLTILQRENARLQSTEQDLRRQLDDQQHTIAQLKARRSTRRTVS